MLSTEKQAMAGFIDGHASYFEEIADEIWEYAELSLKEYKSTALYCKKLQELGFAVTEKLGGVETAFCGSFGSGRPVIGILGEYDALSGLSQKAGAVSHDPLIPGGSGHGCGHNLLGYGTLYISAETFEAYQALLRAMQSEVSGCRMHIISAYRSYARQSQLYDNAVQRYINAGNSSTQARLLALNTTQTPGNSEHQLGCSIDVSNDNTTDHNYQNTPEGQWLAENAHKFGFVLRYPADKEEITRIAYEPWHIRYVGVFHATYMYVNHVCLEEYVALQQEAEAAAYAYTSDQ